MEIGRRVWRSKKAASAAMGIPVATLDSLRDAGSNAFRHGRIYEEDVLRDLEDRKVAGEPMVQSEFVLKDQKTAEDIRRLRIANDLAEGKSVEVQHVSKVIGRLGPRISDLLDRKLRLEYPNAVEGLKAAQIAEYGQRLADQILQEFRALGGLWTAKSD